MTDTQLREPATGSDAPPPGGSDLPPDGGSGGGAPRLGWRGGARFVWTQLTSMRTALVLLFALALAAVPGSLIPQRAVSPVRVSDFIRDNPTLGPLYDRVGLFNVFTSPWFSAIYLLLFVSLVGCIVPRVGVYARALRARPPRTPRNLGRLPAYARAAVDAEADLLDRAAAELRRRRYRVDVRDDGTVAAERGYLREAGNLLFHVSLLFVLLGVALASLYGFRGSSVVIVGQGFANNLTQYDDLQAGARFDENDLHPFSVVVKSFDVAFETGPVQRGAARLFRAEVEVTDAPGDAPRAETLEVNKPLEVDGTTVHLIGHGYAPRVTIKDGDGNTAFSGPVPFLPQDGQFTSAGAIKAPDARPERLAFEGFFLPTAVTSGGAAPTSGFPDALNPALFLNGWYGPPKVETGEPENVYSLDTAGLTEMVDGEGKPFRMALQEGQTIELPDGRGTITMDGWDRWVKLQVGDSPGVGISLAAIAAAVLGLCLSLFVRPRRVWVRLGERSAGGRLLEVGGLDRADARGGLTEDVDELAQVLAGRLPEPEPDPPDASPGPPDDEPSDDTPRRKQ
ncbi:cytochrome c biogenesis protein ResB [Microlunatus capsulatus]|uniref:Cytochrome c biogenesis protein n=1 Tax=Microlunatus capsulatus TaxID=99117 RepID=A0ABS4Z9S4_9ACTN|nr:cytochrome c biogenesis protein [Microlunatus capsulatus]